MAGESDKGRLYGGVSTFDCPNCGGTVDIRAPGQTLVCACIHCGTTIDITNENYRIIKEAQERIRPTVIQLGTRAEFRGKTWEVIGYMQRRAVGFPYYWEEYLLFNPIHGFNWLTNAYGHWNYVEGLIYHPEIAGDKKSAKLEGKTYKMFTRGVAQVEYVIGEFYWYVQQGETVKVSDLVAPPEMISLEMDESGMNWSHSTYIQPEEIKEAFKVEGPMPRRKGVAPNQPNKAKSTFKSIFPLYLGMVVLMILAQVLFSNTSDNRLVLEDHFFVDKPDTTIVTPEFTFEGGSRNVELTVNSVLDNEWMEIEGALYNVETQKSYGFKVVSEYYSGNSGGERWSEGSNNEDVFLNGIPGGRYNLVLTVYLDPAKYGPEINNATSFQVVLKRDVPFISNFVLILIILSIIPIFTFIRSQNFEKKRWADAD